MSVNIEYGPFYCGYFGNEVPKVTDTIFFTTVSQALAHELEKALCKNQPPLINRFFVRELSSPLWKQRLMLSGNNQGYRLDYFCLDIPDLTHEVADAVIHDARFILATWQSKWRLQARADTSVMVFDGVSVKADEKLNLEFLSTPQHGTIPTSASYPDGEELIDFSLTTTHQLKPAVEVKLEDAIIGKIRKRTDDGFETDKKRITGVVKVNLRQLCSLIYELGFKDELVDLAANEVADLALKALPDGAKSLNVLKVTMLVHNATGDVEMSYSL